MVLMHRKDIIERYGFDPAENSSVVEKSAGPTAPIDVVPDDKQIEPPSQETAHGPVGSNLLAGSFKSILSDPVTLYGMGVGVARWATKHAEGDPDASFADGLYEEGGINKVKNHLEGYAADIRYQHPDWSPAAVADEVRRYTTTPEFFEFNTGQMIPPLRNGLRMANDINQKAGVNKSPFQENLTDDTLQTLGGILTPMGFLKVGQFAEKFATKLAGETVGKIAKGVGNVVDWTVVPGVAKYTPGHVAGNVAGGIAVDELQRQITGDPTILPSAEALGEYIKYPQQIPQTDLPATPQPTPEQPVPTQVLAGAKEAQQQAGVGTVLGVGAALGGGALLARHAFRGRAQLPNLPTTIEGPQAVARENFRLRESGFNELPSGVSKAIQYVDEKASVDAPAFQLARELGVEQQLQNIIGQELSPHGQALTIRNIWEDGILPNNERLDAPLAHKFDEFAAAAPQEQAITLEAVKGLNVLSEIEKGRQWASENLSKEHAYAIANPNDPEAIARVAEAHRLHTLWSQYGESIRKYEPGKGEDYWSNVVGEAMSSPTTLRLLNNFKDINLATNWLLRQAGYMTRAEFDRRRLHEPYHIAMWEHDPTTGKIHDPTESRSDRFLRIDVPVFQIDNPIARARISFRVAASASSNMIGRRNALEALAGADPLGREIKLMTRAEWEKNKHWGHPVDFKGREAEDMVGVLNRKSVADALNQAPIDDGIFWNAVSAARSIHQIGIVGGAAAPKQALRSLFYNMVTGLIGQQSGRSIGYVSRMLREATPNPLVSRVADVVDSLAIPDRMLAMGITGAQAAWFGAARNIGRKMALQAITQDGLFGVIARTVPNGEQVIADLGARLGAYHAASWLAHWNRWGNAGLTPNVFDKVGLRDTVARDLKQWSRGTPKGIIKSWGGMKPLFNGFISMMNNIAELHNMTFVAQNLAIEEARLGRPLRFDESRTIAEQARRSAGDMSAQPGGTFLRRFGKASDFGRINISAVHYLMHAATDRGPWDTALVVGRLASVVGAMYASEQLIAQMGLTNWFYERLNDFERVNQILFPHAKHWWNLATGQKITPSADPKDDFYTLPLPQEASLMFGLMHYGLEQLGFVNRGSNRGNTSGEKDILYNAVQTLGLGNIPAVDLILTPFGMKADLSAFGRGKQTLSQQSKGSKAQLGDMPSGIPSVVAEVTKSLLGFNGQLILNGIDAGAQNYKKTHDLVSATYRGWDEVSGTLKDSLPSIPVVWDAKRKHYAFDAMSTETNRIIKAAKDIEDAYSNNFTPAGAMRGPERKVLTDTQLRQMLAVTHVFFERGALPLLEKRLTLIRNRVDNETASKGTKDYQTIQQNQEDLYKQMRPWYDRMNDVVRKYERLLTTRYGDRFRAEGLEPNIDNVVKLVKKYSG